MAGSLYHLVDKDGSFTMDYIDNMGDASEALEECFNIIVAMTGGDRSEINRYCSELCYPTIDVDLKK